MGVPLFFCTEKHRYGNTGQLCGGKFVQFSPKSKKTVSQRFFAREKVYEEMQEQICFSLYADLSYGLIVSPLQ